MSAKTMTDEECYLAALLMDESGIDLAEFSWIDEEQPDNCYRLWDFQWPLYRSKETYQIDFMGRSLGKTVGIIMRSCAFIFNHPGQELLIGAPELNHLRPVTDKIEHQLLARRLTREMLPRQRGNGINHQPQFQAHFVNNARIVSRLPNRDGRGFKGCVEEGTLILTKRGQVPVEEIVPGDRVLTHEGQWRRVLATYRYEDADGVKVVGGGHAGLKMSDTHMMLTRRNRSPCRKRSLEPADWTGPAYSAEMERHYLGSPTAFPAMEMPWPHFSAELAWITGRYVADGFISWQKKRAIRTSARLHIIVKPSKMQEVKDRAFAAFLRPSARLRDNNTYDLEVSDTDFCRFVETHFGKLAQGKEIPTWLLGAPQEIRQAFLDGYLSGDGSYDAKRDRWVAGTASKKLAIGLRLLGQSLGWSCGFSWHDPKVTHVMGIELKKTPMRSFKVTFTGAKGVAYDDGDGRAWHKIRRVEPVVIPVVYDLAVEEDHSYIADGLISHNQHPLKIELDEGQDVPDNGWIELIETMKAASPGASWRVHGVSRGVRDRYYRYTMQQDPDIPFYVHRYMAMHRPSWGPEERKNKIAIYGGTEDNVDYRRNVYGEHGDASATLFVLHRLMACVRVNESTWASQYNDDVYAQIKVNDELLKASGAPIETFLQFPGNHLDAKYVNFWGGVDVGFTRDPTEILIWGEIEQPKGKEPLLRLLARIHLMRISADDQAQAIRAVFAFYGERLRRVTLDKTGVGLPLWQALDPEAVGTHMDLRRTPEHISRRIQGYGFSQKVAVEFDDRELTGDEKPEDALIEKNIVSFAADMLRKYVDTVRLELPYDAELLSEWQGQEIQYVRDEGAAAGIKTKMVGGSLHTLDAAFMMIAGKELMAIEELLRTKPTTQAPVLARFGF